jgi:hypothetical protein
MRIIAFLCVWLWGCAAIAADGWVVGPAPSDEPDFPAALVTNATGDTLYIWSRRDAERFQIFVELHPGTGHRFGTEMPRYSIDGGEEIDTERIRQDGEQLNALWGYVGPTATSWLVWTSIQDEVLPGDRLYDWFNGSEVVISWRTAEGTFQEARFTLAGARAAILEATGVKSQDVVN